MPNPVNISINLRSPSVTSAGFGIPLTMSVHTTFAERLRIYTSAADMLTDGFTVGSAEYLIVNTMFSQVKRPERVIVGRRNTPTAQIGNYGLAADTYTGNVVITINGAASTFVASSSSASVVITGLLAELATNAEVVAGRVSVASGAGNSVDVTSLVAGVSFTLAGTYSIQSNITITTPTPNVGIAEDLALVSAENDDWYALLIPERDRNNIFETATRVQSLTKLFLAQSADAAVVAASFDSGDPSTDIASELFALNFFRTSLWYDSDSSSQLAAAVAGRNLPEVAGSITWAYTTLVGVSVVSLTTTQESNLLTKNGNSYGESSGASFTFFGQVSDSTFRFIDVLRGQDQLVARIEENMTALLIIVGKIQFTQRGMDQLEEPIRSALVQGVTDGYIAETRIDLAGDTVPGFSVQAPNVADISAIDKAARAITASNPIVFDAQIAGAVHTINVAGELIV